MYNVKHAEADQVDPIEDRLPLSEIEQFLCLNPTAFQK